MLMLHAKLSILHIRHNTHQGDNHSRDEFCASLRIVAHFEKNCQLRQNIEKTIQIFIPRAFFSSRIVANFKKCRSLREWLSP
jgi:hypothetical protein